MSKEIKYELWSFLGICLAFLVWLVIEDGKQLWFTAVYAWQDICNFKLL
jgi:hypothetical protein